MSGSVPSDAAASSRPKRPASFDVGTLTATLKSRLKVMVVCLSHSWGGLEQVAASDSQELAELDLDVSMMCLAGSPIHEYLEHEGGVTLHTLDYRPRDFFDFRIRKEISNLVAGGTNLFHLHQTSLLPTFSPWLWRHKKTVLIASRHIMNEHGKRDPFHAAIYRRVDALVVMSRTLRKNVMATHRIKERQLKVIHLGLDFDRFNPETVNMGMRSKWGAEKDTVVIGLVGRIDPAKGQSTFLKAAASILKKPDRREKLLFVIVGEETLGSTGVHLEELKAMTHEFRIEDRVVFAGYQENVPEVMGAIDIFVMPSLREAFGLVAIEAMSMKCPIIISRGGSSDEIVGNEEYGLLVRPEDAFDLSRQIEHLIEHPELRLGMGRSARAHVMEQYDRKVRIERTLGLYERSLRRRGL